MPVEVGPPTIVNFPLGAHFRRSDIPFKIHSIALLRVHPNAKFIIIARCFNGPLNVRQTVDIHCG